MCFDLSKAYDNLNHAKIIMKLKAASFPSGFLIWLSDYFHCRYSQIKIHGQLSQPFPIETGVAQGSVLSPFIFASFASDLECARKETRMIQYADDINYVLPIASRGSSDVSEYIKEEVENVEHWCVQKDFVLNKSKSRIMMVSNRHKTFQCGVYCESISMVNEMRILGVVFNSDWNWNSHIHQVCKMARKKLYLLRKLRPLVSRNDLHLVYTSCVRSVIEYASPVFVGLNKTLSKKLEKIDRRAHRVMFHDEEFNCECGMDNIRLRRCQAAKKLFKVATNKEDHMLHRLIPQCHRYTGRRIMPYSRTETRRSSFVPFTTCLLNDLNECC